MDGVHDAFRLRGFTGRVSTLLLAPSRGRVWTWRFVAALVGAVTLVRLAFVPGPLKPDEAGYLMVARAWHLGGPNLYGHYFVDRPPLLIALFRVASWVHWDPFVRVLTVPFAALFVVSAAWAAHQLVGDRGARWAGAAAAALVVTPLVQAYEADGEIFAAPLVMLAVALTLTAVRRRGGRAFGLAVLAGLVAGLAVMTKQNFVDAFVFAAALVLASVAQRRLPWGDGLRVALGGLAGGAVVLLGTVGYVVLARVGVTTAWFSLFGFRGTALDVIADSSLHAPLDRGVVLVLLAFLTGILPVAVLLLREGWRCHFSGPPVAWAVAATMAVEVAGIAAGGSYWPHYLLQLAPMTALAVGLWAPHRRSVRLVGTAVLVSAVVAVLVGVVGTTFPHPSSGQRTGAWVHASGRPGDTATVLYGNAQLQEATGMASPYRQLWSLPTRTIDVHLRHLRALLAGPRRPDWVVVWSKIDLWNIDPHGATRLELATHYHLVRHVCGHQVWLADGEHRDLAPPPVC